MHCVKYLFICNHIIKFLLMCNLVNFFTSLISTLCCFNSFHVTNIILLIVHFEQFEYIFISEFPYLFCIISNAGSGVFYLFFYQLIYFTAFFQMLYDKFDLYPYIVVVVLSLQNLIQEV